MKKIISTVICILLSVSLIACGNEKESTKTDSITNSQNESSEISKEYITEEYCGLSFEHSSDAEYKESDSSATLTFEPKKKFVTIIPTDTSSFDQELLDTWNELSISSVFSQLDNVQDREDFDTTIADIPAKGATAFVKVSGIGCNYSVVSVIREDFQYQYNICYVTTEDADTDNSKYEAFIDSISFE